MADLTVRGARVVLPTGVAHVDVSIDNGVISGIGATTGDRPGRTIDATGMIVTAGLIDVQCNGAGGSDFTGDPSSIAAAARVLPRFGVTAFLPTIVTAPAAARRAAIAALPAAVTDAARPLGLHFEGPAISADHLGAHDARFRTEPTELRAEVDEWIAGGVRMVTLAPELDGAIELVATLSDAGVTVSAGHTAMTPTDFAAAKRAGLRSVTHLFNAMAPFGHRSPGPVGAVLADDDIVAGLICDGVHVDPLAVRAAWRTLGPGRVLLVSDASAPLGLPYGRFRLGRRELIHDESGVRTPDGTLAGSALPLDRAIRHLCDFAGCDWADAVSAATSVPADLLGRPDLGRITPGAAGDIVMFDDAFHPRLVVIGGQVVHRDEQWEVDRWKS